MTALLAGRTAIVTGASSGIGKATAELLGGEGAHIFLVGRSRGPLERSKEVIERAGGQATIATFDITATHELQQFIDGVYEQTGRLDILVNTAGVDFPNSILEGTPDEWQGMIATNVLAVLAGAQAAVRAMRRGGQEGHIVTISSIAAQRMESGVYGATKHAVNVIMATLRKELEQDPIRVTTIMPGAVATNFARNYDTAGLQKLLGVSQLPFEHQPGEHLPEAVLDQVQSRLSQVLCSPRDVAQAVLFAVTQPISVNIAELVVRPPRGLAALAS